MRVLITGIDGFVGSHAAELLLTAGSVEVHGTIITPEPHRNIAHLKDSLTLYVADITDAARMENLFRAVQPDRVMHIAGQAFVPASMENPLGTFQANLFGGLNVLEASRKLARTTGTNPQVLVVSSGEVYGGVDAGRLPIKEDVPLNPNNPYAASKAGLDLIAQQYARTFGLRAFVVRPFNHIGARQSPTFVVSDFAKQFAEIACGVRERRIHVGNIAVQRDFTDVRDVVRAYWQLFDRTSEEIVFNVSSGRAVPISEILEILQKITGLNVEVVSEPQRIRAYDIPLVVASHERLQKATGWTPQLTLHQTLHDIYTYWLDEVRSAHPGAPSRQS